MKLIRAKFRNFRILRDLEVRFSVDPERNLTVFRAESETGRTTMLTALQWALYGEAALPGKGQGYSLLPDDWTEEEGPRAEIEVEVDFEAPKAPRQSPLRGRRAYRIRRSATESTARRDRRFTETVSLVALSGAVAREEEDPGAFIDSLLSPRLRQIFFADGDRAMSFRRNRVQSAIESLPGLAAIDSWNRRVRQHSEEVDREIREETQDATIFPLQPRRRASLDRVTQAIEEGVEGIVKWTDKENEAREQYESLEPDITKIDKKIEDVLRLGDQQELAAELARTNQEIEQATATISSLEERHSNLFRSKRIANGLLSPAIAATQEWLEDLVLRSELSSGTAPVLEDCLNEGRCVCGDLLEEATPRAARKREHIQHLIEESRQSDEHKRILMELFYRSKDWIAEVMDGNRSWVDELQEVLAERDRVAGQRDALSRRCRELETKLDAIKGCDIQDLRESRRYYEHERNRFRDNSIRAQTRRRRLEAQKTANEARRRKILRYEKGAQRIIADLEVIKEVEDVLKNAYRRTQTKEIDKVSARMNQLFVDMISADAEQSASIQGAEVSQDFDIRVYCHDRRLNPDRVLTEASRRALIMAFTLAVTEASESEAPNTMKTPLGMASGPVKSSVLRIAADESAQLILFLTRDEIKGCESIIDERAGQVITLTNPAHYPRDLVHRPVADKANILPCACDHRKECRICERRHGEGGE